MWAYAFHPFPLVPKVLDRIRKEPVEIILVAPWWPKRVWSLDLLELSVELPRALPLFKKMLLQLKSNMYHLNPQLVRLHTWRLYISPKALDLPDSLMTWHRELQEANFAGVP